MAARCSDAPSYRHRHAHQGKRQGKCAGSTERRLDAVHGEELLAEDLGQRANPVGVVAEWFEDVLV